ncbi:AAA domain-containing protein [Streptomyces sasae]|uniref:AAA domain-containing protein n=1 Tax=Streptomyces sasae TaxID=1266772 RepID=UPI00292E2ECF|nr:AAA domain-containing protein [Streptomyces sasae]
MADWQDWGRGGLLSSVASKEQWVGNTIKGRFALLPQEPRAGGLSEVRKAVDLTSAGGDYVAVKLLKPRNDSVSDIFVERETSALKTLEHPNIVRMLDSGWDSELERYFIALEWVDRSLKEEMAQGRPLDWLAYFARFGGPLVSALAYAHEKQIEHRDLKPANVLLTDDGTVKLADFGIAKIFSKAAAVTDETVADFRSSLYAPPDLSDAIPYVRDVYAYAVLAIQVLSGNKARDYADLQPVLDELDLDPGIRGILGSCIDYDPQNRPANAIVLESKLLAAQQVQDDRDGRRRHAVWLKMTRPAATFLSPGADGQDPDWEAAKGRVLSDISGTVHVDFGYNAKEGETDTDTIRVFGRTLLLRLKSDRDSPDRSVVIHAEERPEEWMARRREQAVRLGPSLNWTFDDPGEDPAYEGLGMLLDLLYARKDEREAESKADKIRSLGDLFDGWRRVLEAREEVLANGRQPIEYARMEGGGQTRVFHLASPGGLADVGEEWSVAEYPYSRPLDRGEVTNRTDDTVVLRMMRPKAVLPSRGVLLPSLGQSQSAINRQRDALSAVAAGQSTNPLLRQFIDNPDSIPAAPPTDITTWVRADLDKSKQVVVSHALGTQDLLLIEGPPGTGKTTVIAEIVEQTLKRNPHARILIVSQTHIAIDNALARLEAAGVTGLVRLGRAEDPRVAASAQHLLLDRQVKKWTQGVRVRAEKYLDQVAAGKGLEPHHLKAALLLEELAAVAADLAHVRARLQELSTRPTPERTTSARELGEELVNARARQEQLLAQRGELFGQVQAALTGELTLREDISAGEARDAAAVLLGPSGPGRELMNLLRLQGEWLQRVGNDQDLISAFLRTKQVVGGTAIGFLGHRAVRDLEFDLCIFDEASKATATEALVPLARAKRWILVGDTNQLPPIDEDLLRNEQIMTDHQLIPELVKTTLFQYLANSTDAPVKHLLREQYRMTPAIGNMISSCFYDRKLISPNDHTLDGYAGISKPVLWLDTSPLEGRRESDRTGTERSISNRLEAKLAMNRLKFIDQAIDKDVIQVPDGQRLDVLVIAPYGRQVDELNRGLADPQLKLKHISPEVLSVDAVQGRECDLAVFSVTRSNTRGHLGFLAQPYWRRINVALSRARFGLTIIGDAGFCRSKPGALRDVLDYMSGHPEDCEIRDAYL